jgi:hypothetical protein
MLTTIQETIAAVGRAPERPRFESLAAYRRMVDEAWRLGLRPWEPESVDEAVCCVERFPEMRPARGAWPAFDARMDRLERGDPLTEAQERRVIATMLEDPAKWGHLFRKCLAAANGRGAAHAR